MKTCVTGLLFALAAASASCADPGTVTVLYRDKPPYSYTKDGKPAGFLIERTADVFRRAHVEATFQEMPVKRITRDIRVNASAICSPTWYKLPERAAYARFSLPIHQDKPHLVLVGAHVYQQVHTVKTLRELFANPRLRLGKVSGVSYGAELDALISTAAQTALDTTVTPLGMAKMIKRRRADYMLIDEEDYNFLTQQNAVDAEDVKPMRFPDMPPGLLRYIMCSKSVSPETMARLNKAIAQVIPAQP
jgi:polar amino acid transport system substrate-binding protein